MQLHIADDGVICNKEVVGATISAHALSHSVVIPITVGSFVRGDCLAHIVCDFPDQSLSCISIANIGVLHIETGSVNTPTLIPKLCRCTVKQDQANGNSLVST